MRPRAFFQAGHLLLWVIVVNVFLVEAQDLELESPLREGDMLCIKE